MNKTSNVVKKSTIANSSLENLKIYYNKNPFDINKKHGDFTPLMLAVMDNNEKEAIFFLEKGAEVTIKDGKGFTVLIYAIYRNMYKTIKKILEVYPKAVEIKSNSGIDALSAANIVMLENVERYLN